MIWPSHENPQLFLDQKVASVCAPLSTLNAKREGRWQRQPHTTKMRDLIQKNE